MISINKEAAEPILADECTPVRSFILSSRRRLSLRYILAVGAAFTIVCYVSIFRNLDGAGHGFFGSSSATKGVQYAAPRVRFAEVGDADEEKARQVVDAMRTTFWKYRAQAWGHDDVKPLSGGYGTSRNGWGAFIVDSSTTLSLMGLWEELQLEVDYIVTAIDFTKAKDLVDPFETIIRYLGALVSLTGMFDNNMIPDIEKRQLMRDGVLSQAVKLASKLAPAFNSPTGMMWHRVDFRRNVGRTDPPNKGDLMPVKPPGWRAPAIGCARAGSNMLEYSTLTALTGNAVYVENATRTWAPLVWNTNHEEWPGLIEAPIDIWTGEPRGRSRSWDGGHDSYYEYLIKAHILEPHGANSEKYRDRWVEAVTSLRTHLASRSMPTPGDPTSHLYLMSYNSGYYLNRMGHLCCFAAGNIMLGGRYLGRADLIQFGVELLEGCHHMYAATPSGIGPEAMGWLPADTYPNATTYPTTERGKAQLFEHGFWAGWPVYKLRPEYVESVFYAWRLTGNQTYRDWAWDAFTTIENITRAEYGYASVANVMVPPSAIQLYDDSESFWSAETLKYLFLTFADSSVGSLDEWVYSTEAHLFRIRS
ncbi:MAG: hypothetical protein M1825_003586 [Sarcosagium campestre]|nr:MAG: hypothetical protein M1825_003586 [Sarcosagium campestre]